MRPDEREFDDEIRGHLALSIKERIDRGEDPFAARAAALRELGYIPDVRDSMRRVWYSRVFDAIDALALEHDERRFSAAVVSAAGPCTRRWNGAWLRLPPPALRGGGREIVKSAWTTNGPQSKKALKREPSHDSLSCYY